VTVHACPDDDKDGDIPYKAYYFADINEIAKLDKFAVIDFVGIVQNVEDCNSIKSRNGKTFIKRSVVLLDDTKCQVELTLWDAHAKEFDIQPGAILVVKNVKVNEYNGRHSLNATCDTTFETDNESERVTQIRAWYEMQHSDGSSSTGQNIPRQIHLGSRNMRNLDWKSLHQVEEEDIGKSETVSFWCRAMVTLIRTVDATKLYYKACPAEHCNKKVMEEGDAYFCPTCKKTYSTCKRKYLLSAVINDATGSVWVSLFDAGASLLHETPDDFIPKLLDTQNFEHYATHRFMAARFVPYNMRIVARKPDTLGYAKPRYSVDKLEPLDFVCESKKLIALIQAYL